MPRCRSEAPQPIAMPGGMVECHLYDAQSGAKDLRMTAAQSQGSRSGAIERARAYVESGAFERDLARRVAYKTESQKLPDTPAGAAPLSRRGDGAGVPAHGLHHAHLRQSAGRAGAGAAGHPHRGCGAADRARLRPRRRHPRPGGPVDQGQGSVGDGARRRPAVRPRHRRQQGPAHHQHGGARGGDGRARRAPRLQCQVHHRDGRGGGLQGPRRAGARPTRPTSRPTC